MYGKIYNTCIIFMYGKIYNIMFMYGKIYDDANLPCFICAEISLNPMIS